MEKDNLPYALRIHDPDAREEISEIYDRYKSQIDNMGINMGEAEVQLNQHLTPVTNTNPNASKYITQKVYNTVKGLSQNLPMIQSPLYGETHENYEGKANYIDAMNVLSDPEGALNLIGDGKATPLQISVFRSNFPSIYADFKDGLVKESMMNNMDPSNQSLVYGTTGIETSSNYSKANMVQAVQQQMIASHQPPPKPQKSSKKSSSSVMSKIAVKPLSFQIDSEDGP